MSTKYILTNYDDKLISAKYINDECSMLNVCDNEHFIGDIFIGRVENVVKNINACFIQFNEDCKGYYALSENDKHIFLNNKNNKLPNIGDKILVQVKNPPHKTKPHTLTSKIEIPGNFLVLSRDVSNVLVSKKIQSNENAKKLGTMLFSNLEDLNNDIKHELSNAFTNTNTDLSFGFILRSNAKDASFSQIIEEATKLKDIYKDLLRKAIYGLFYTKVYESAPSYISDINHLMYENDFEVITDSEEIFNLIAKRTNIDSNKLRLYKDDLLPLYSLYSIKSNITNALKKNVWLKSGAYLVIEETEALTVIDVNSGKFISKKGKDKDLSNYRVNIEAAKEALLQLRLRNISGIIIIDFINMKSEELNLGLLKELRGLAKCDELPTKIVDMTKLGLVEITRTKKGQTLKERMGLNKNE